MVPIILLNKENMQLLKIQFQIKKQMKRQEVTRQYQENKNQKDKKVKVFIHQLVELLFLRNLRHQETISCMMRFNQNLNQ